MIKMRCKCGSPVTEDGKTCGDSLCQYALKYELETPAEAVLRIVEIDESTCGSLGMTL